MSLARASFFAGAIMGISQAHAAWNKAIRDKFYSSESDGKNVYLDLDDRVFEGIGASFADPANGTKTALIRAVRDDLWFGAGKAELLENIYTVSRNWITKIKVDPAHVDIEAPPMLGFLAVSVLAAERMGSEAKGKGQHGANAYYPVLADMLGLQEDSRLKHSFKAHYLELWKMLHDWLDLTGNRFGYPTAYSVSHRYIGAAMSQALVRDIDRKKLPNIFASYNLEPGSRLDPETIETVFDHAVHTSTAHGLTRAFQDMWGRDWIRPGLLTVLAEDLAGWDGTHTLDEKKTRESLNLNRARIYVEESSNGFGAKKANFSLAVNLPASSPISHISLAGETTVPLNFWRLGDKAIIPISEIGLANPVALLEAIIGLTAEVGGPWNRSPEAIVVLELSTDRTHWLEVSQVSLGRTYRILVRQGLAISTDVDKHIAENALGDYSRKELAGSEGTWICYDQVQLGLPSQVITRLGSISPKAVSQLRFEGGITLPSAGTNRAWLTSCAPRLIFTHFEEADLQVDVLSLAESTTEEPFKSWSATGHTLAVDLDGLHLRDGRYAIAAKVNGVPVREAMFRLHSSKAPDARALLTAPQLAHDASASAYQFATRATVATDWLAEGFVSGFSVGLESDDDRAGLDAIDGLKSWGVEPEAEDSAATATLPLVQAPADSCLFTGVHYWEIESNDAKTHKWNQGTCRRCQSVALFTTRYWVAAKAKTQKEQAALLSKPVFGAETSALGAEPASHENDKEVATNKSAAVQWPVAIELVRTAVHGSYAWLVQSLQALATDQWSSDQIAATLENLGHIEMERGNGGWPKRWALSAPQIIQRDTELHLLGNWPPSQLARIAHLFKKPAGGYHIAKVSLDDFDEIVEKLGDFEWGLGHPTDFSLCLPPLSAVRGADTSDEGQLKARNQNRKVIPAYSALAKFNLQSKLWSAAESIAGPGAYRLDTKSGRQYGFVDDRDIQEHVMLPGSASFVKWLAINLDGGKSGTPIKYSPSQETLALAQDMPLFGLYSRALLAGKGAQELFNFDKRWRVYSNVSPETANDLYTALLS